MDGQGPKWRRARCTCLTKWLTVRSSAVTRCTSFWPAVNFDQTLTELRPSVNQMVRQNGGRFVCSVRFVRRNFYNIRTCYVRKSESVRRLRWEKVSGAISPVKDCSSSFAWGGNEYTAHHYRTMSRAVGGVRVRVRWSKQTNMVKEFVLHFHDSVTIISTFVRIVI